MSELRGPLGHKYPVVVVVRMAAGQMFHVTPARKDRESLLENSTPSSIRSVNLHQDRGQKCKQPSDASDITRSVIHRCVKGLKEMFVFREGDAKFGTSTSVIRIPPFVSAKLFRTILHLE